MASGETQGELIGRLQSAFGACVGPGLDARPFALLDFPGHANVGDSAIWLGETAYFRQAGRAPAYVSTIASFDQRALARAVPDGPIFLHGGGNFGDVWPHHQHFRERVIAANPDRPIVQLPQSIHYRDAGEIERTARIIERHPDFLLLVRDHPSLELATRHFACRAMLCPDAAFMLGPQPPGRATMDVLALMRTDGERSVAIGDGTPPVTMEDWLDESRLAVRLAKLRGGLAARARLRSAAATDAAMYEAAARHRLARGLAQLRRARAIVTDRLHVHILSLLLGLPHAVLDNEYGKIARFMDAFSGGTGLSHRANGFAEAVDWARGAAGRHAG